MSTDYGERLKRYRIAAHLKQKELADILNIDPTVLSNWERGKNRFDVEYIPAICKALNINANDLLGFYTDYSLNPEEEKLIKAFREIGTPGNQMILDLSENLLKFKDTLESHCTKPVRTIQRPLYFLPASAGNGQFLDNGDFEMVDFPEEVVPNDSTFAVKVSGDSMEPVYKNGSIVFVKQAKTLNPGEIGIFILNGEGYFKVLGRGLLKSINQEYKDIKLTEYDDIKIVGKVVGVYQEDKNKKSLPGN